LSFISEELINVVSFFFFFVQVEAFSNCHNMSACNIWESMYELVVRMKDAVLANEELKVPLEAVKSALSACYYCLLWDQQQVENTTERNSTAEDVITLRQRLDRYMQTMKVLS